MQNMADSRPSVSVCVLSYNRPKWLEDTLNSLCESTSYPFELIINDDGSSTNHTYNDFNTYDMLGSWQNFATIITNPPGWNEGVGRSINKCFKIATGDILIKVDTDLDFTPGWLETVVELFEDEEHARLGLLGLCHYYYEPVDMRKTLIEKLDAYDVHTHILGSCFAVRREVYEHYGISSYSESFSEDWELMKKIEADPMWHCGLPIKQLASNYGMGLGTSTVALSDGQGGIKTAEIHKESFKVNK
jgi:glycosyltransferase involved in cell wall biosynthesis